MVPLETPSSGRRMWNQGRGSFLPYGNFSTSYGERQDLKVRMSMLRFTRLTNAFSKKPDNHIFAIALHFMHDNFCRLHKSLRMSPAMAAGISDRLWWMDIFREDRCHGVTAQAARSLEEAC